MPSSGALAGSTLGLPSRQETQCYPVVIAIVKAISITYCKSYSIRHQLMQFLLEKPQRGVPMTKLLHTAPTWHAGDSRRRIVLAALYKEVFKLGI
jgi:hypothetical protein